MAEPKSTAVSSPSFSTILTGCGIGPFVDAVLDRAEQNAHFQNTHGRSRYDWDAALSLHLRGDLQ